MVEAASDSTWERCIFEAMKQFHEWFYLVPLKLLDMFPLDFVDDKGNRFWSGEGIAVYTRMRIGLVLNVCELCC